jgi:hypothetical protein
MTLQYSNSTQLWIIPFDGMSYIVAMRKRFWKESTCQPTDFLDESSLLF